MEDRRRFEGTFGDPAQAALPGALSLGYPLPRGRWDEMVLPDGALRPHWERFMAALSALPGDELQRRWDLGLRLIRENGVTYNVYSDPRGLDRLWQFDPLPMILGAEEWAAIEAGLIQRATLLDQLLADLYGEQKLIAQGLLPAALALAHPAYLRPLRNVAPTGGRRLHLYAADLARSPDGKWWVVSDRCEAPSGAGYALESRSISARALGDVMRTQTVRPLSPFFEKMRETLARLSPHSREAPHIVVLSPGPYNATYFEHAYLARHLGCTLVEGGDLTMRGDRVWLKTLGGLQPVDVILRRTLGSYCDPLELRAESLLGVAGLVQAVRAGNVVVANGLGSGVAECGALATVLPRLSQRLLGEPLRLDSVPTWWCGSAPDCAHVLSNLDRLVVKRTFAGAEAAAPIFGERLTAARRAELAAAIRRRPIDYVAQEQVPLSTVPLWTGRGLDPRPLMLRVFLTAHEDGYVVMPGGLTRVAAARSDHVVSIQDGGGSKDTWLLADQAQLPVQVGRPQGGPVRLARGTRDLPSRVADNLFWFGRYLERGEDTARLFRAVLSRAGSMAAYGAAEELPIALSLLSQRFRPDQARFGEAEVAGLASKAFDATVTDSLRFTADKVHRMASMARDRLSADTWRAVNRLLEVAAAEFSQAHFIVEDVLNVLNNLVLASESLSGLVMENMTRGAAWRFVDFGRRLERSIHVVDTVGAVVGQDGEVSGHGLDVLLEVSDSAITYRSRYLSAPQLAPVLDLLVSDESNPRSLGFQLAAMSAHCDHLAAERRSSFLRPEQRLMLWCTGAVRTADAEVLGQADPDGRRHTLDRFLEILRSRLWELSEVITGEYFAHTVAARRNSRTLGEPWL